MRTSFSPQARRDLTEAVRWIKADHPSAARALADAVFMAADRVAAHPDIGRERPDISSRPVRFLVLTGFPYVIVYDPRPAPPLILRILHAARDLPELLHDL